MSVLGRHQFPRCLRRACFCCAQNRGFRSNISLQITTKRCDIARRSAHRHSRPSNRETMTSISFFEYIFSCEGWYLSIPNQLSLVKRIRTVVPHASYLTRTSPSYLTRRTTHAPSYLTYTHRPDLYYHRPPLLTRQLFGEPAHCATLDCDQKDAILFFLDAVRWLFKSYMAGVDGEQGAEAGDHGEPASMRTLK